MTLLAGFETRMIEANGVDVFCRIGGLAEDGSTGGKPALLLIHGYPQTGEMWHTIADRFTDTHVVIVPDLRGYGRSATPETDDAHSPYSFREMAADLVAVMASLGFSTFTVFGHDRGARVTHRMCLDHPEVIQKAAVLDIIPTLTLYESADQAVATAYYHWYFFIQKAPYPETLIGADPKFFLESKFGGLGGSTQFFDPAAMQDYIDCFTPAVIHGSCEDYRAGATIDLDHDRADLDRRITCPLLVLWGAKGPMGRNYDVLQTWRERADDVRGHSVEAGHYLVEENPEPSYAALAAFLHA